MNNRPMGIGDFLIELKEAQTTVKGDVPGHEFHGNQYSDGGGSSGGESSSGGSKRVKDMTQSEIVKPIHDGIVAKINQGLKIPMGSYTGGAVISDPSSIRLSKDGNHIEVTRRGKGAVKWDRVSDNTLDNWASKLKLPGLLDWEMAKSGKGDYADK